MAQRGQALAERAPSRTRHPFVEECGLTWGNCEGMVVLVRPLGE
jgi:hypothetical protein